jgi:hypothetical protein
MNLHATLAENLAPAEPLGLDPLIARAERWLCMLAWLVDLGGWLTGGLAHQAAPRINEPKWSGPWIAFPARVDPSVVYERVSRAVRLALALRMKIKTEIAALRAGKLPSWAAPAREAERERARPSDEYKDDEPEVDDTEREAPERAERPESAEAPERPENLEGDLHERLRESDRFYKLLNGPLKDAVAAICLDLGLKADWSQWTEDGFPPPPGGDVRVWGIFAPAQCGAPPPPDLPDLPDLNEEAGGPEPIIWRPSWPRPRRPKPASPFSGEAMRRWEKGLPP